MILANFKVCNTVLLNIGSGLYGRSLGFIHFI